MKKILLTTLSLMMAGGSEAEPLTIPITPPAKVVTNYFAVQATRGGMLSDYSNEVATTNISCVLSWDASPSAVDGYVVSRGRKSGNYTVEYMEGTNLFTSYPFPQPPTIVTACVGGVPFFCATNPAGSHFFSVTMMPMTGLATILDSQWVDEVTNPFSVLWVTNSELTIIETHRP